MSTELTTPIKIEIPGIAPGKPEWGAEPGKLYFVITWGK